MVGMRHELEGKLYRAAMKGETKEMKLWLEVHFPETYKPSTVKKAGKEKDTTMLGSLAVKARQ